MKRHLLNGTSGNRSPLIFFSLVFLLSIPIWAIGPVAEQSLPGEMPTDLPISALMAFCPVIAAVILVRRQEGSEGVKTLLGRAFDYKGIKGKTWYVPILFLWPALMVLEYGLMKLVGVALPDPRLPVLLLPVSFAVFFVAALGEEVGWQGYVVDPLQDRWNALTGSIIVGIVWAVWHFVPFIQMGRTPTWIAWQSMGMVATRVLIVWLYNNTRKSVFAAILFHAMNNVTTALLPNYGWHYDPLIAFIILAVAAVIVTLLWGPETLARYRYARPRRDAVSGVAGLRATSIQQRGGE
jgi:membrane protease YdiL (CAAX protease family)